MRRALAVGAVALVPALPVLELRQCAPPTPACQPVAYWSGGKVFVKDDDGCANVSPNYEVRLVGNCVGDTGPAPDIYSAWTRNNFVRMVTSTGCSTNITDFGHEFRAI